MNIEEGQVAAPVLSELGYHILKLLERTEGRPLNIDEDFDIIRNMARQQKTAQRVDEWVEELKKKVYVEVRDLTLNNAPR
jgi:parvulin-like peptidyl-prolyl isomerase